MRLALLTTFLLMLVGTSCSGYSTPVSPKDTVGDLPSWNIRVDGMDYTVGPADLIGDRQLANGAPGSDMTADELRVYFAWNLSTTNFPTDLQCTVYSFYMLPLLMAQPDATMFYWVTVMEGNGYDVPNGPPPEVPC